MRTSLLGRGQQPKAYSKLVSLSWPLRRPPHRRAAAPGDALRPCRSQQAETRGEPGMKPQRPHVDQRRPALLPPGRRQPATSSPATMRAVRLSAPGSVDNLRLTTLPLTPGRDGWVRIRVEAFGLNRSELKLRLGLSVGVSFPRVPGFEAAGTVDAAPAGSGLARGQTVVAMMGTWAAPTTAAAPSTRLCRCLRSSPSTPSWPGRCWAACRRWCRPPTVRSPSGWT